MRGIVRGVVVGRGFGFTRVNNKGEYFFHRDDFNGHWDDLVSDASVNQIEVEFEPVDSLKGLRAANVRRLDYPNEVM